MKTSLLIIVLVYTCGVTPYDNSQFWDKDESEYNSEPDLSENQDEAFPLQWLTVFGEPYSIIQSIVSVPADAVPEATTALQGLIQAVGNSNLQPFLSNILLLLSRQEDLQRLDTTLLNLYDFTATANEKRKSDLEDKYDEAIMEILAKKLQATIKELDTKLVALETAAQARLDRIIGMGKQNQESALGKLTSRDELLNKKLTELETEIQKMEKTLDQKSAEVDVRVQSMLTALNNKKDEMIKRVEATVERLNEKLAAPNSATAAAEEAKPPTLDRETTIEQSGSKAALESSTASEGEPVKGKSESKNNPIAEKKKKPANKKGRSSIPKI